MTEINRPDVVSEVRNAFDRYNAAIDSKDVVALNDLFWKSDGTVRFGYSENLFGHEAIVQRLGRASCQMPIAQVDGIENVCG